MVGHRRRADCKGRPLRNGAAQITPRLADGCCDCLFVVRPEKVVAPLSMAPQARIFALDDVPPVLGSHAATAVLGISAQTVIPRD
jgi:hypothetical protein